MNIQKEYASKFVYTGLEGRIHYGIIFAGVRERIELCDIPESLKGFPISLIAAALVSVAFFGFQGLFQ